MSCPASIYGLIGVSSEICDGSNGGLKNLYVALKDDVKITITGTTGDTSVRIATIAPAESGATPFKQYQFRKNTSNFTSTLTIDQDNASQYWTTVITTAFKKMDSVKRMGLMSLVQNDTVCVCEDNNGLYWLVGADDPVYASNGTAETGTQRQDANQYTVELSAESKEAPYECPDFDPSALVG